MDQVDTKTLVYSERVVDLGDGRTGVVREVHGDRLWEMKRQQQARDDALVRSRVRKSTDNFVFTPDVVKDFKMKFPLLDESDLNGW